MLFAKASSFMETDISGRVTLVMLCAGVLGFAPVRLSCAQMQGVHNG